MNVTRTSENIAFQDSQEVAEMFTAAFQRGPSTQYSHLLWRDTAFIKVVCMHVWRFLKLLPTVKMFCFSPPDTNCAALHLFSRKAHSFLVWGWRMWNVPCQFWACNQTSLQHPVVGVKLLNSLHKVLMRTLPCLVYSSLTVVCCYAGTRTPTSPVLPQFTSTPTTWWVSSCCCAAFRTKSLS